MKPLPLVFFESDSSYVTEGGQKRRVIYHENTVSLIKPEIGNDTERNLFGNRIGQRRFRHWFCGICRGCQDATGLDKQVVITVPGISGLQGRKRHGRLVALRASMSWGSSLTSRRRASVGNRGDETMCLLIYDLGGGTFDCTVIEVSNGKIEVIVIDSNRRLWCRSGQPAVRPVTEEFCVQAGVSEDPTDDEDFAQRLLNELET